MNKTEYVSSQKDCAKLLGMSFSEYNQSLKKIKKVKFSNFPSKKKDETFLAKLGISKKDLKKRVC